MAPTQLPEGFEVSSDPRYAFNQTDNLWLDLCTGGMSYFDQDTHTYVPVQTIDFPKPSDVFEGVVRLVVVNSSCFATGQVADINIAEGLDIGRDRSETGSRHLRIPDIEVSRFHAKMYLGEDANAAESCVANDEVESGSEDGEIDEPSDDVERRDIEDVCNTSDLSDGECQGDSEAAVETSALHTLPIMPSLFIVDQGSTYGTFVNGVRLSESKASSKPFRLHHLDHIAIGQTSLQLHVHEQWVCAKCKNTGDNEISTHQRDIKAKAASQSEESAARKRSVPITGHIGDLQKDRVENLKAIKNKYMTLQTRGLKPGGNYTDRARLRRRMLGDSHQHQLNRASPSHSSQRPCQQVSVTSAPSPIKEDNTGYSLLRNMGWTPGAGLGANEEGIVDPVEVEGNADRVGLGAKEISSSEAKKLKLARATHERFSNL
ncbi:hypothetical protein GGI04_002833 [Coemansia thaxteri]|nr:hypothetical protein GGI04_002833 [Coemansia thaxteri]